MHKYFFIHFSIALAILLLPHLADVETSYVKKSATKLQAEVLEEWLLSELKRPIKP